jgi:putative oxidoreductase
MKFLVLLGRILFSLIFLNTLIGHFSSSTVEYAAGAGVPLPSVLVPLSGIIAFLGGVSILLGYKAKIGAWLIVIFLIPVSVMMHNFWAIQDAAAAQTEMTNFMKNLSMLGGALFIAYFGSGPLSLDSRVEAPSGIMRERARVTPKLSRERDKETERAQYTRDKEKTDKQNKPIF